ncbi:MAG: DUF4129 domain-containing protein [Thermoguttaceae bacterium]
MPRRLDKTLTDYLVIAISPALIMALIGSLVFFLIEVLYQGNYAGRLNFIMALFVMATVLIGRISIEEGAQRAALFGLPLAIVAALAMNRFVRIEGVPLAPVAWLINWGLLALIWWCAHKLTWDCTLIDEAERDPGEGLLQAVGLKKGPEKTPTTTTDVETTTEPEDTTSTDTSKGHWWERLFEHHQRPHTPGLWVIYFSLAALPLFGIGQLFIPAANLLGRQFAFRLLCVYVGSGLGLLLTTSFLGLRRYLRQRGQEMPPTMTGLWMTTGSVLIVGLLLFAALLPRPGAEYAISRLPFTFGSPDQQPSQYGLGNDGPETDEEADRKRVEEDGQAQSDEPGDGPGESEAETDESSDGQSESESNGNGENETNDTANETDEESAASEPSDGTPPDGDREDPQEQPESAEQQRDGGGSRPQPPPPMVPHELPVPTAGWLVTLIKWLFYAGLIYCLWHYRHELLAMAADLMRQLREFWQNLWGGKSKPDEEAATEETPAAPLPSKPFASFDDPFTSGMAERCTEDELVRYTFEALEAWAREHDCGRESEQTPHEFARNVGVRCAALSGHAQRLADLYCRVAYARGSLPPNSTGHVRRLWEQLREESVVGS